MTADRWSEVDSFLFNALGASRWPGPGSGDAVATGSPASAVPDGVDPYQSALAASTEAGLPPINVSSNQGKMLWLLGLATRARSVLEVGTLGGFSTLWLARAVGPEGRVVTLELEPRHAEVARANIARAGFADRVEVRVGRGVDSLAELEAAGDGPFDLVFIDADKPSNADYFAAALRLSRPGTVIVVDNVVRDGRILEKSSTDPNVTGVLRVLELIAAEPTVVATAIQTVGSKGYDGFVLAVVVPAEA